MKFTRTTATIAIVALSLTATAGVAAADHVRTGSSSTSVNDDFNALTNNSGHVSLSKKEARALNRAFNNATTSSKGVKKAKPATNVNRDFDRLSAELNKLSKADMDALLQAIAQHAQTPADANAKPQRVQLSEAEARELNQAINAISTASQKSKAHKKRHTARKGHNNHSSVNTNFDFLTIEIDRLSPKQRKALNDAIAKHARVPAADTAAPQRVTISKKEAAAINSEWTGLAGK